MACTVQGRTVYPDLINITMSGHGAASRCILVVYLLVCKGADGPMPINANFLPSENPSVDEICGQAESLSDVTRFWYPHCGMIR